MKTVTVRLLSGHDDAWPMKLGHKYEISGDELKWYCNEVDLDYTLEMILTGQYPDIAYE